MDYSDAIDMDCGVALYGDYGCSETVIAVDCVDCMNY